MPVNTGCVNILCRQSIILSLAQSNLSLVSPFRVRIRLSLSTQPGFLANSSQEIFEPLEARILGLRNCAGLQVEVSSVVADLRANVKLEEICYFDSG